MKQFLFSTLVVFGFASAKPVFGQQSNLQVCAEIVNQYCQVAFSKCFINQYYQSISVTEANSTSFGQVKMAGVVSYRDAYGNLRTEIFNAQFVKTSTALDVSFQKFNTMLGQGWSYWEPCNLYFPDQVNQPQAPAPTLNGGSTTTGNPQQFINDCVKLNGQMAKTMGKW